MTDGLNFTNTARRTIQAANDESAALKHEYIGTEHLLLALLRHTNCTATSAITKAGGDPDSLRASIIAIIKPGSATMPATEQRPYTSRTKKIFELAMIASRDDNHAPTGTHHLLLGMLREKMGIAAQSLVQGGVTLADVEAALGEMTVQEA